MIRYFSLSPRQKISQQLHLYFQASSHIVLDFCLGLRGPATPSYGLWNISVVYEPGFSILPLDFFSCLNPCKAQRRSQERGTSTAPSGLFGKTQPIRSRWRMLPVRWRKALLLVPNCYGGTPLPGARLCYALQDRKGQGNDGSKSMYLDGN